MRRKIMNHIRRGIMYWTVIAIAGCGVLASPGRADSRAAGAASKTFSCDRLVSNSFLRSVTGLRPSASPKNSTEAGTTVTCVFTFVPGLPPGFPHSPLKFSVSATAGSIAEARREYAGRLKPIQGLGSHAFEEVSSTGLMHLAALGHGFVLDLVSGQRRVNATMTLRIAQAIYKAVARV
jgi:hypothetical protein